MQRALPHDYWYRAHYPGDPSVPFLKAAFDFMRYQRELRRVANHQSLWQNGESYQRMRMLVDRFVERGAQWSFTPVVLLIPSHADMQELRSGRAAWYERFKEEIAGIPGLTVFDAAEVRHKVSSFYLADLKGHASPEANRAIAEILAQALSSRLNDSTSR